MYLTTVDILLLFSLLFFINITQLYLWDEVLFDDYNAYWFITQIALSVIFLSAALGAIFA